MRLPNPQIVVAKSEQARGHCLNGVVVWGFLFLLVLQPGLANNGRQHPIPDRLNQQPVHSAHPISAEEAFTKFASRVLFLSCDLGPDDAAFGSGVLVSSDGLVATNAHVVEGCHTMRATYLRGSMRFSFTAALKYYDSKSDTAIVKIDAQGLSYFDLGLASLPRVGERVYAIGNPRGMVQSISEGIVSGIRQMDEVSWIQHSAAVSPGSSGGALIGADGELLGINSFLLKESQNLNFAVPASSLLRAVLDARARATSLKFPSLSEESRAESATVTRAQAPVPPPKPDFSGRWRMVKDQSDFAGLKAPDIIVRVIEHRDPTLNVHTVQTSGEKTSIVDVSYFSDGSETTNSMSGRDAISKAFWDGAALVIRTTTKDSHDEDEDVEDIWELSEDHQTLTISSHITTPKGSMKMKLVCKK
jgi:S1-C subfamily serine protease